MGVHILWITDLGRQALMDGIEASIEDYLADCRARGLRQHTVADAYGVPLLRLWLPWCRERGVERMQQISQRTVNDFTASMRERRKPNGQPLSSHSIRTYGVVVSRWLAWESSDARVPRGRVDRPVREVITEEEFRRMLDVVRSDRDRLMLQLLWDTGMRASELLQLRTSDLVRHDGRWFLRVLAPARGGGAKGGRERLVPLPRPRDLQRYIAGPRSRMASRSDHVFLSRRRDVATGTYTPLLLSGLEQMIHDAARDAGIVHRVYPHLFRHSAVTRWLRQGVDPLRIAAIVGHSGLEMIHQHYSQLDHRDAYDALAGLLVKER
jgi:integrase/recombinase XerD